VDSGTFFLDRGTGGQFLWTAARREVPDGVAMYLFQTIGLYLGITVVAVLHDETQRCGTDDGGGC